MAKTNLPKRKKRCCGNCVWFIPPKKPVGYGDVPKTGTSYDLTFHAGECRDAVKRARTVVPFAINLSESLVYAHGGQYCPCFDRKADLC